MFSHEYFDIFAKKAFQSPVFLQPASGLHNSFIFRLSAFLESLCTKGIAFCFADRREGEQDQYVRRVRFMNFTIFCYLICFYGKRFYHDIYPHPRPHPHSHSRPTFSRPLFPRLRAERVAKCLRSWVWVWVNVVGKKKQLSNKKKIIIIMQKVVKFMKRRSPRTYQSHSPFPRSTKQISESFSTNGQS